MRCLEAAAKAPMVHVGGPAIGVLEVARQWAAWVDENVERGMSKPTTLGLPGKGK